MKQHENSPDDLTVIWCERPRCRWRSEPQTVEQMRERGLPWYCDRCGERVTHFVRYHPGEAVEAGKVQRR